MSEPSPTLAPEWRRGRSWVAALRRGATVPWTSWDQPTGSSSDEEAGSSSDRSAVPDARALAAPVLPGAQQLELLRRINLAAQARGVLRPEGLAERVLGAGLPDRSRPDLPLVGLPHDGFGPSPVAPETLPDDDLLVVVAGLLAEQLASRGTSAADRAAGGRLRPMHDLAARVRRPATLHWTGDPWARAHLGSPAGDGRARPTRTLVLAGDLATLATHAWAARCVDGGGHTLEGWLRGRLDAERLPVALDLTATAARWAGRVGVRRTVIVTDPAQLPRRLRPPAPAPVDPGVLELTRRVGRPLGVRVSAERRRDLLVRTLVPASLERRPVGPRAGVPEPWWQHLHGHAERMAADLTEAGYPVVGSLRHLVPRTGPVATGQAVATADALRRGIDLLLDPSWTTTTETKEHLR